MADHRLEGAAGLPEGEMRVVDLPGCQVVLRNVGGNLIAIENACPHRGGPVGEGEIEGDTITCPWHGWSFNLNSGQSTMNPAAVVRLFPCRAEGDDVVIDV